MSIILWIIGGYFGLGLVYKFIDFLAYGSSDGDFWFPVLAWPILTIMWLLHLAGFRIR